MGLAVGIYGRFRDWQCGTAGKRDPVKFCQMLIQELEMTEAKINSELRALKADEDADA